MTMTQRNGTTRVFGVMQELQQLRTKVSTLSEKNRELAKALTTTKQELTKARTAQNAVFSNKVVEWMETQYKAVQVQHQATQCNLGELDCRYELSSTATTTTSLVHNKTVMTTINEYDATERMYDTTSANIRARSMPRTEFSRSNMLSPHADSSLERMGSQVCFSTSVQLLLLTGWYEETAASTRYRHVVRRAQAKHETPANYYGLGKRTGKQNKIRRSPKARMISGPLRAKSSFVPALFEQQCGNSVRRRTTRAVKHVSYTEPKLNTKLRQDQDVVNGNTQVDANGENNATANGKADQASLNPNSFEEQYTLGKVIGSGTFSVVRIAVHKPTSQRYAIKCIKREATARLSVGWAILTSFLQMNHPNIMILHDFFVEEK
ncbi:Calcium/calmodulin-dependent protein kinase, partial [Phytophthora palmivora]